MAHIVAMSTTINSYQELKILITVIDCASFTAAAQVLDLPKSSVSRRISAMEERLGVRLLQRTTRSVRATTAGEAYYETGSKLLRELEDLEAVISAFARDPVGALNLTCPSGFVAANHEMFAAFNKRYSKVSLLIRESDAIIDLVAEGIDLAFRGGRPPDASLSGFRLLSSKLILVASPNYLNNRKRPQKPHDLLDHKLLNLGHKKRSTWYLESGHAQTAIEIQGSITTNNQRTILKLAESGLGIALIPESNCHSLLAVNRLEQVLPEWTKASADLWLVYPSNRGLASSTRAFIDSVKAWPQLYL